MSVSRKSQIVISAITLLCLIVLPLSANADTKSLNITSPSSHNRVVVYDSANLHLFVFGGDDAANEVRLVRMDKKGKIKGNDLLYDGGSNSLAGLDVAGTRNGYLVTFWEHERASGASVLKLLRVVTEEQPVSGIGQAAEDIDFVKEVIEKDLAKHAHANLAGIDAKPIGETTIFGMEPYNPNAKKRKWGVHGVVSLRDNSGERSLDLISASFLTKFGKKSAILKTKIKDTSAALSGKGDMVPGGFGRAGLVGDRAQWYFSLLPADDAPAAPALGDGYRVFLYTDIARNFPFSTTVSVDAYGVFDNQVILFAGFGANSLRSFYAEVRYNVEGANLVPNRVTGYERSDSGVRFNSRIAALVAPKKRAASTGPATWTFSPLFTLTLPVDRFFHVGVNRQVYPSAGGTTTDCRLYVTKWDLNEGGPVEMNKEEVPLNHDVYGLSMARFVDPNQPIVMIYASKDTTKAGAKYSFSLVTFKADLNVIGD